jgi:hypothetical protein
MPSTPVQRLIFFCHPAKDHPKYFEWQTGHIVIFVADRDRQRALEIARRKVAQERWLVIRTEHKSTLIEERVRREGGDVWAAYEWAQKHGEWFRVFPVQLGIGDKQQPIHVLVPRITEAFIDSVVERAGGHRLTAEEANHERTQNADYLLDDCVFELKILDREGLDVSTRQQKLAQLFRRPLPPGGTLYLDHTELTETDQRKYMDIVGRPIQDHLKTASKQIASTKRHLGRSDLRGGVICVNTGYGTLPRELFTTLVSRYAVKDTSEVRVLACVTSALLTNGFDTQVVFAFDPQRSNDPTVTKLHKAFMERVGEMMDAHMRSGMQRTEEMMSPLRPISFESEGVTFAMVPPSLPDSRFPQE